MENKPRSLEYSTGTLTYTIDQRHEEIEFYYPFSLKWDCTRCGTCCQDTASRDRRVLLLDSDTKRFKEAGYTNFHEETENEKPFVGVLKKKQGRCIFLGQNECMTYHNRALLCRMYPFWIEKNDEKFIIRPDLECPGFGDGKVLDETFFNNLLSYALQSMKY